MRTKIALMLAFVGFVLFQLNILWAIAFLPLIWAAAVITIGFRRPEMLNSTPTDLGSPNWGWSQLHWGTPSTNR